MTPKGGQAAERVAALARALVEEIAQALRIADALQLGQRPGLYLADALAGQTELLSDLFECPRPPILEAEAQFHDLALTLAQQAEDLVELLPLHDLTDSL
jgi:hypothetical protein